MHQSLIRVAFGSVPKDGGTFTFYKNQWPELEKLGVSMYCVTVGREEYNLVEPDFIDANCRFLAQSTYNVKRQAKAFVQWCIDNAIDIVIGVNSKAILSAIPHLPEHIRVVSRCANAFDHGYKITMVGKERLMSLVALTPRLKDELIQKYDANPTLIKLIPNGIKVDNFEDASKTARGVSQVLRLGFLGRLEHTQKGVLHIPKIIKELNKLAVNYKLSIAGKGRHQKQMEEELKEEVKSGKVEFIGAITNKNVPEFLSKVDLFLFTSHFEGCPNALLEAMMAGCVPISWNIRGITDYIIDDNESGFLIDSGNYKEYARTISHLNSDRELIKRMSQKAIAVSRKRFTSVISAKKYAKLFGEVMGQPPLKARAKSWARFKVNENFRKSWKDYIPISLKHKIKMVING